MIPDFQTIRCETALLGKTYLNLVLNQVLAAQTRLAQELHRRPELYELYLTELLTLFADKGVAIQNVAISNHHAKVLTSLPFMPDIMPNDCRWRT